ncbi:PREDICTED: transcriptional regulator Myc-A-like [Camelina sativa]|uniref:Transcriptional regulator Myc-A-like n=1 Tax=Camelina sativa TaxID=90675 RepID=A0ABM0ST41_CAMSA|nr:PREDICTED: transcriptional regulator Myc-A-like [Camelina sativa]
MEFPEKSLKVTIPVKAPVMSSSKPEKEERKEEEDKEEEEEDKEEEEEEDGCTTPKGEEHRIPPQHECPPAPRSGIRGKIEKRRAKSAGQRSLSFNVQELDTFFARIP